jgi:hypothetical protein
MAMTEIESPMATASIRWISALNGGRKSGPPTAPVYMTTAVFRLCSELTLSILIQKVESIAENEDLAKIGFLFPDLARPMLQPKVELVIMEGPKIVAEAIVRELL